MNIEKDSPGVRFPPPLVFIGTLLIGVALGGPGIPMDRDWSDLIGWFGIVAGMSIVLTALGLFRRAGTRAEPWRESSAIVTDGVYRWTRNPMYLGMALTYAGIALLCDSLIALALLVPVIFVIQRQVIEREEAYLIARFGEPYRDYMARVRRWF
ncbi:isoprenylcysteine carboxylmethyltransferase family protein [Sphingomonas sp. AOB5]|uniref:methyltransferase family protein n=1 Tax=Sphingomonas sp. AOB5 TaxID=3034017 RepID=UPI0023F8AA38|nr:isoprenylcysteine carboxylmethyltransferase family protein [Sphingomonas sp. AOB5]MDF7775011.1 isoprenylcysteine carboxylmethyltransferase family protein [Sphingomonas sp. AOB5]